MRTETKRGPQSIRSKLLYPFLAMIGIFALVSFFSYYSEQFLLNRINILLANNIKLKEFSTNIDDVITYLEKYLISRNFNMLREYFRYSQEIDSEYSNLTVIEQTMENNLLLENIRNMTRSFLQQAENAVQAKRARDSAGYHQSFVEVSRYGTNIKWAIERLITRQLEENSRQFLLISNRLIFIQKLGLVLIIGALIFSIAVTFWTSFHLTKPLRKLVEAAKSISKGNFSLAPLQVSTKDEIAVVATAFNEMASGIAKLINEIKRQTDLEKRLQEQELQNLSMKNVLRESELHALQSQINPHFLFNMLNAGVQLALMEGADKTADFVDKVSSMLRYNLQRMDNPVTLQEEANYLETYFFILKTRYGSDRFQFTVRIAPNVLDYQIPLLTLQPIVENALIHGIEELEEGGKITVEAFRENDQVVVQITDNGRGIDSETLNRLQNGEKMTGHTTGLGLHNVKERCRLFFGKNNLIQIQSIPNQGTTIQLNLPVDNPYWGGAIHENTGRR
jgi:two-component system, sensor histidine kinase YesM